MNVLALAGKNNRTQKQFNCPPVSLMFCKVFHNRIASRRHSSESDSSWLGDSLLITQKRYKLDNALHCKCYFLFLTSIQGGLLEITVLRFQDFVNTTCFTYYTSHSIRVCWSPHYRGGAHWFGFIITHIFGQRRPHSLEITINRKVSKLVQLRVHKR